MFTRIIVQFNKQEPIEKKRTRRYKYKYTRMYVGIVFTTWRYRLAQIVKYSTGITLKKTLFYNVFLDSNHIFECTEIIYE